MKKILSLFLIFWVFGSFGQVPIGNQNQNKNIALKPAAPTLQFQGYPNAAEYTYISGIVSANGGVFSTAITTADVDNLVLENTSANQWICIGKDETGIYIVSLKTSSIGAVKKITPTKTLVDVGSPFSSTAIPGLTTRIKVDISTSNIVIATTQDGVNYTTWGLLPKSAISSSYQKRLGVLNLSGNVAVFGGTLSASNAVSDSNTFTINGDNIKELGVATDYILLLNSTELSGARKLKISDLFSQFGAISTEIPSSFTKIIAVGTSITYGVGATGGNSGTTKWVSIAQQGLTDALGRSITIVNAGVSGQTTTGMLSNLPSLLSSNTDASVVIIEAAINDAKTTVNGGVDIALTKSNIQTMISLVKNAGKIPVLSTPAPIDMSNVAVAGMFDNAKRTAICLATVALAKANNVRCADINTKMSQNYALLADGLHPNDSGHLAWANVICSEILK